MKYTFKVFGAQSRILCAIAMLAAIAFSMAACDDGFGGGDSNSGANNNGSNSGGNTNPAGPNSDDTASISAFESWLLTQPANTPKPPIATI